MNTHKNVTAALAATLLSTLIATTGCAGAAPAPGDGTLGPRGVALAEEDANRVGYFATGNCTDQGGGAYACTDVETRAMGYAGYMMLDALDTWADQKVKVTNTGSIEVIVASEQGLNVIKGETHLKPGESTVLSRIDVFSPTWGAILFADGPKGDAHVRCEVLAAAVEAAPAPEATRPAEENLGYFATGNCTDQGGGAYACTDTHERGMGYAGYMMLDALDTWADQKVKVTNTGSIEVIVASEQGLNVIKGETHLKPGESTVLSRIDVFSPTWGAILFADGPKGDAHVRCEVQG